MDEKNIGFRQYKLPLDIALNQNIFAIGEVQEEFPAKYAVDGKTSTYCKILGDNKDSERELIIYLDKEYECSYFKIFFKEPMEKVSVYDYSNDEQILLYKQTSRVTPFLQCENYINRKISAIKITDMEPHNVSDGAQIIEIQFYNNIIEPPEGYYIKDIEIQSNLLNEEV